MRRQRRRYRRESLDVIQRKRRLIRRHRSRFGDAGFFGGMVQHAGRPLRIPNVFERQEVFADGLSFCVIVTATGVENRLG